MNRAERRRQQKLAEKADKKSKSVQPASSPNEQQALEIEHSLNLAVQHHNAGDLPKAESIYQHVLQIDPAQPVALNLLGVIAYQVGKNDIAVESISKALAVMPDYAEAHNNLGNALGALGKPDEAVISYHKALALKPDYAEAHSNLGNVLRDLGKLEEAVASYYKAVAIKPDYFEAHNNLGVALHSLEKRDEAVASYQKALAIKPDYADAHYNLGTTFRFMGRLDEAIASYQEAIAIRPDYAGAHNNLAIVLNSCGRGTEALGHFKRHLMIERGDNPIDPHHKSFRFITKAKMIHDIEQFHYLASAGDEAERFQALAEIYETIDKEIDWPTDNGLQIPLCDDHLQRLGDTYNRPIHLLEAPGVTGSPLSSTLDVEKITANYFSHAFGMTYFDNLLSATALAALRRFMLGSTIWFDFNYKGGYLGAVLKHGLACPLILQIADELRHTFPDIFKDHQLTQLWAYKYDSNLTGIEVHADFAAVNVNFWITPQTANLNPASGGLVVYDVEAPMDWDFKKYNTNAKLIREHLADHSSGKIVVPYGENRMVLFNSNLFHETDSIDFKPGYENRRINVTMLFGRRQP